MLYGALLFCPLQKDCPAQQPVVDRNLSRSTKWKQIRRGDLRIKRMSVGGLWRGSGSTVLRQVIPQLRPRGARSGRLADGCCTEPRAEQLALMSFTQQRQQCRRPERGDSAREMSRGVQRFPKHYSHAGILAEVSGLKESRRGSSSAFQDLLATPGKAELLQSFRATPLPPPSSTLFA